MCTDSTTQPGWYRAVVLFAALVLGPWQAGCTLGPRILHHNQREYNESVKCTDEEELLLNLVRLRYNDDIGLLNTNSITAQYEAQAQVNAVPFFALSLDNQVFSRILPAALVSAAGRPTFSLAPVMDSGVYRRLFKPVDDAELFKLAELSWPTSTVFRLWFQYANGVPNAVTASGPTRECPPEFETFQAGMKLLEELIERGLCTISTEDKVFELGSPLPANSVTPAVLLDAVRHGYEYRQKDDQTWVLVQIRKSLVLKFSPEALAEPEVCQFREIFHLKHDALSYPLNLVGPEPRFPDLPPPEMAAFNLVPRSGIQLYFYLAHGIEVPDQHLGCGLAKATVGPDGECFDWRQVTQGLFAVHHSSQHCRPKNAHIAVKYHGHWFYIADDDAASKSTFALVLLMARIEFGLTAGSPAPAGPALTLPVGR
jgi:hypothetical protein